LRVPAHTASGSLFWRSDRADAALTIRGQSRAADVYGDIKPFVTADLAGSYALTRRLRITARVENLTDTHYQEAFGYGEPGIAGYFGFRLDE
jgi:vitamin B12 transporter